jgi:alpha-ketoglutarate-dependent taurine dioxygenase
MTMNTAAATGAATLAFIWERGGPAPYGGDDLSEVWSRHAAQIDRCLWAHGAVLFRNFGVDSQEGFESLMRHLQGRLLEYVDGNSPRTKVSGGVYTSTEYPPEYSISLHNELSYSGTWPGRLFFCCVQPPASGGQTPLVDSRRLLRELPANLVETFRRRKVRYIRNLHGGKGFGPSWQQTYQTDDKAVAERAARETDVEVTWLPGDTLRLCAIRPATAVHPETSEEVWFNQADQFHPSTHPEAIYRSIMSVYKGREEQMSHNATFADGSAIPLEYFTTIRETTQRLLTTFSWEQGDLLMVDNMLAAHGRMPFTGARRILVSMTA